MSEFRKFAAAVAGAVAASVASGGDWRVVVASGLTAVVVFLVPNEVTP